jgi:hypothetical protein
MRRMMTYWCGGSPGNQLELPREVAVADAGDHRIPRLSSRSSGFGLQ